MKSISTAKPNGAATLRSVPLLLLLMGMLLAQGPAQAGKVANKAARPPAASAQAPTPAGPAAPTGVSAAPGNGLVTLTWNASAGAAYYNVYGSTDPKALPAAYTQIGTVTVTDAGAATDSFTQTGLVNTTTYYYYVVAENNSGLSPPSAIASTLVSLPAPTGLTATPGNSSVTLNWTASTAPGASFYEVFESATPSGTFTQIGTVYGTTFTQTGLTNGASYSYYLVPVNNGGVGTQSATISSTVSLPAPTNLAATAGNGTVTVTWTASAAPGASYYSVFQSTSASGPYANVGTVTETGGADSFTQTGLTNGAAYYYYVVANNNGSASPNSQTVSAIVSLPAPTGLTATAGSGSVTLNWTASGAPGASFYEVFGATAQNGAYADLGPVYGTDLLADRPGERDDVLLLRHPRQQRRRRHPLGHRLIRHQPGHAGPDGHAWERLGHAQLGRGQRREFLQLVRVHGRSQLHLLRLRLRHQLHPHGAHQRHYLLLLFRPYHQWEWGHAVGDGLRPDKSAPAHESDGDAGQRLDHAQLDGERDTGSKLLLPVRVHGRRQLHLLRLRLRHQLHPQPDAPMGRHTTTTSSPTTPAARGYSRPRSQLRTACRRRRT